MPGKQRMSTKSIQQRREAGQKSTTHGAYAFRDRGEAALTETGRSRLAELAELVQSRSGVLGLLQERVVNCVMMCELIESYLIAEDNSEKTIIDNTALKVLPAYMNSANRSIQALMKELPGDKNILDEEAILRSLKDKAPDDEGEEGKDDEEA
jgi:hypothetical protein